MDVLQHFGTTDDDWGAQARHFAAELAARVPSRDELRPSQMDALRRYSSLAQQLQVPPGWPSECVRPNSTGRSRA
ncbi:hypothetical protein ACIPD2_40120 [Streptomyces griseofuscus]|uniref:hypothetical protein n=1 Tax=Streptomyces griseofuscus TaxID=146922 RepID=UPI00380182B3